MASVLSRSVMGRTLSTLRHISAASQRRLMVSLLVASNFLKDRSSPHWASVPKNSVSYRRGRFRKKLSISR